MGLQNMQNQAMGLVLSTDAKPRLKWTSELHQRFIEAVNQLGGADKATPKSLMRVMGVPGLTLYHLKSHLQKYRLGKNQQSETCSDSKQDEYKEETSSPDVDISNGTMSNLTHDHMKENFQIAHALQMQMEVQRRLHEQIEVQRHLQMRIEAQGKYLQNVLKGAQETLANCTTSSLGLEHTKVELSQLASMVSTSPLSELTDAMTSTPYVILDHNPMEGAHCSIESSLTSSESSDLKGQKLEIKDTKNDNSGQTEMSHRTRRTVSDGKFTRKRCRRETIDLNRQFQGDPDLGPSLIDLDSQG